MAPAQGHIDHGIIPFKAWIGLDLPPGPSTVVRMRRSGISSARGGQRDRGDQGNIVCSWSTPFRQTCRDRFFRLRGSYARRAHRRGHACHSRFLQQTRLLPEPSAQFQRARRAALDLERSERQSFSLRARDALYRLFGNAQICSYLLVEPATNDLFQHLSFARRQSPKSSVDRGAYGTLQTLLRIESEGLIDRREESSVINRFGQEVDSAHLHGLHAGFDITPSR